jgi:heme/copper-type cytochrome/quinol oxidase subunit 1
MVMTALGIQRPPFAWFVLMAALLMAIGIFDWAGRGLIVSALDTPIYDTHIVIAPGHVVLATALFCLGCGGMYWAFSRALHCPLNRNLGALHAVLTFAGLQCIYLPVYLTSATTFPLGKYEYTVFQSAGGDGGSVTLDIMVTLLAGLFLIGQLIFLVNVIGVLVKPPAV